MIGALRTTWRQASAICLAEWLRMLTTPAWAALLILWTLVCGLFFQVVVTHAAHNELPIGETPLTAFFRFFPGLLPVLLIVFVPQLSMDLLAGRRESGRLEQLQLAGVQPLALILGGYVAVCSVLVVLAVPILLFHGVLAGATNADPGATLGGIFALLIQSAVLAALSVAVGAWAPTRLAASLTACALGLIWWIFDLFAPAIAGAEAMGSPWHRALALADTVHDFAGGLIEWRPVVASVVLVLSLLALARLGLLWRIRPGPRLLSVATVLLATLAALTLSTRVTTTSDITWSGSHGISEHSIAVVKALAEEAPVTVTLIATPGMRNDPADGPLLSGVRTLLQRLAPHGVDFQLLDPERSPKAVVALRDRLHIADRDLQRPVLVAEHLNRAAVLPAARLGAVATGNGRRTLARLDAESALVAELQRLHGELPTVAWLTCPELRVIETPLPHRRAEAVGAWRRQLSAEGFAVEELADWSGLSAGEFDLAVVAGPQTTLPSEAVNELRQHLLRGGHLLLALDAEAGSQNELRAALANYGVGWGAGYLTDTNDNPALELVPRSEDGPAGLAFRDREHLILPKPVVLNADQTRRGIDSIGTWLPAPAGSRVHSEKGVGALAGAHPTVLTSRATEANDAAGRIVLLSSAQALADGDIDRAGNRLLAVGLARWLLEEEASVQYEAAAVVDTPRSHLPPGRVAILRFLIGIGIPLLAAFAGTATWWWRRRP